MKFIDNLIQKRAVKTYAAHDFVHEYGIFIALVLILKVAASVFNGYAGYYLLKNYLAGELNHEKAAIIAAITTLVLIEFLVNITLAKFFKTSLRGHIKSAIGLILLSAVFFVISFLLTTNGMAQRQAQKADNTAVILDKYNVETASLKAGAESQKAQLIQAIETIRQNPSGWRSGKRDVLQPDQLADIKANYSKIEDINNTLRSDIEKIETNKQAELKVNSGNVLIVEEKFYKTSVAIMILQLFVNGIIMFFYSRIYKEKEKERYALEHVESFANDVSDYTSQLIESNISNQYHSYIVALEKKLMERNTQIIANNAKKNDKNDKKIGFINIKDAPVNNDTVPSENIEKSTNEYNGYVTNDLHNEIRVCKHCGKSFKPYSIKHLFCTETCRMKWHKENDGFDLGLFNKRRS